MTAPKRNANGWRKKLMVLLSGCLVAAPMPEMRAQYPGHINLKVKNGPVLRSIAVLEWTGEAGKPSASRLIPISVFDDGQYQAGGLYLARPAPMALDSGTEYQLMRSGLPQGIFDVAMAQQLGGGWIGYGAWKPMPPPAPFHKLKPARIDPEVVDGGSDRRPHFRKAAPETDSGGGTPGTPPEDPDRPTLRKRAGQKDADADTNTSPAANSSNLETATGGGDPDRPRLTRGGSKSQAKETPHLEGTPPNLEQMVAVSDAETRPEHSFVYSWPNPDDAARLKTQLEEVARKEIAKIAAPALVATTTPVSVATTAPTLAEHHTLHRTPGATTRKTAAAANVAGSKAKTGAAQAKPKPTGTTHATHIGTANAGRTATARHLTPAQQAAARRRALAAKKAAAAQPVILLTDVEFHAFELTYSGGATLVYSARTAGDEGRARYVTVIAQPDIYGVPQVLFTQVTSAAELDATPRLRLIDAVDAAADNRGELLFELRGSTSREFALYRVASGRVDQMIATGPLPLGRGVPE